MSQVQSIRQVGCKKGFPYFAFGVYEPRKRLKDGKLTYRLVKSGPWFRSDVSNSTAFEGIPIVDGVRHGTLVKVH